MDKKTLMLGEVKYDPKIYNEVWKMLRGVDYLYWVPRLLGIGMILFLALFALDVFEETKSFGEILTGLFMHLMPNYILAILLYIAWKKERLGGLLFLVTGLIFWFYFNNPFIVNLIIFGPLFLTGILFIAHDFRKD